LIVKSASGGFGEPSVSETILINRDGYRSHREDSGLAACKNRHTRIFAAAAHHYFRQWMFPAGDPGLTTVCAVFQNGTICGTFLAVFGTFLLIRDHGFFIHSIAEITEIVGIEYWK